jgi:hypothetical protein
MALGYEGYVKLDGKYALGTGTSVPRARVRMESSSGYGGQKSAPVAEIGIGTPRTYDWETHDGSLSFELNQEMWKEVLNPWVFDRQVQKEVYFTSRFGNVQKYTNAFWNSISVSATEQAVVDGSLGFVAIERTQYAFGTQGFAGYTDNKTGQSATPGTQPTVLCPSGTFPEPLNGQVAGRSNINPIPWWNTKVLDASGAKVEFVNWTLDFSQDIGKFFACTDVVSLADPGPKEPDYLAAGPMTVTFSGAYMFKDALGDDLTLLTLNIDDQVFKLKSLELQSVSDDVQTGDVMVPLTVEYAVYDIDQA